MNKQATTRRNEENTQQQTTQRGRARPAHAGARWLAAILLAGAATVAPAQQVIFYDDFAAGSIDPTKWIGAGFGRQLEEVKLVSGGALLAGNISYGDIGTNSGSPRERPGFRSPIRARRESRAALRPSTTCSSWCPRAELYAPPRRLLRAGAAGCRVGLLGLIEPNF